MGPFYIHSGNLVRTFLTYAGGSGFNSPVIFIYSPSGGTSPFIASTHKQYPWPCRLRQDQSCTSTISPPCWMAVATMPSCDTLGGTFPLAFVTTQRTETSTLK